VRLAIAPDDAPNYPGSLQLKGSTGYNETRVIETSFVANEDTIDIHFEKVPTAATYTLTYIGGDGQEWPMSENVPFHNLQDDSEANN
jgi:hypothetical protein